MRPGHMPLAPPPRHGSVYNYFFKSQFHISDPVSLVPICYEIIFMKKIKELFKNTYISKLFIAIKMIAGTYSIFQQKHIVNQIYFN